MALTAVLGKIRVGCYPGDWHIVTDVSERYNASIFRVKLS